MNNECMVQIQDLHHGYAKREVLKGISLAVDRKEIFGLLGPNGSGKTTLFRILSTAFRHRQGKVAVAGHELPLQEKEVREKIGVVFQHPSLDGKLTIRENLSCHGALYGLAPAEFKKRAAELLERLGLSAREQERVDTLSGGLKRRAELAKALLSKPSLLIMDEPSTGLDPGARIDLWRYLRQLRDQEGTTILLTTHLMEEADQCDRLAVLSRGKVVGLGRPEDLKREISGDVIVIQSHVQEALLKKIRDKFSVEARPVENEIQIEHPEGAQFMAKIAGAFSEDILSITCRRPTLEDVFIHKTGHHFWNEEVKEKPEASK